MGAEASSLQMSDVTIGESVPLKSLPPTTPSSGKVSSLSPSSSSTFCPPWTLHRGEDINSKPVSLFVYPKPEENSRKIAGGNGAGAMDGLPAAFKHAKVLRHPSLVKFQGIFTASDGRLVLVTEPVSPLLTIIDSMTVEEITAGIYSILSSLVFLHDRVGVCHNNVALSSIFVASDDGAWKLGALDHLKTYGEATWDWLRTSRSRRDVAAITPEEKQKGPVGGGVEAAAAQARDAYALGQFTMALLNYIEEEYETQEAPKGMEEFKAVISAQFLHTDPKKRPRLSSYLNHVFFKNNNYCDIINFLDTLPLKSSEEKEAFFVSLSSRLSRLSPSLVAFRLVRPLLRRFVLVEPSARINFVPHLLTPKPKDGDATPSSQQSRESSPSTSPQHSSIISTSSSSSPSSSTTSPFGVLSADLFAETVIPHLCKIVLVRDHDIFLTLLRFLPQYLHLIPKDKLEETFLPQMLLGLQDASDDIVAASLGGLSSLVPLLGGDAVIGRGQDSQQSPRTKIFAYGAPRGFQGTAHSPSKQSSLQTGSPFKSPVFTGATTTAKKSHENVKSPSKAKVSDVGPSAGEEAATAVAPTNSTTSVNAEKEAEERRRKTKEQRDKSREERSEERKKKIEQRKMEKKQKGNSTIKIKKLDEEKELGEEEEVDVDIDVDESREFSRRSSAESPLPKSSPSAQSSLKPTAVCQVEDAAPKHLIPSSQQQRQRSEKQRLASDVSECPPRPLAHVAPYIKKDSSSLGAPLSHSAAPSIPVAAAATFISPVNEEGASGGDWPDWSNDDTDDDVAMRSVGASSRPTTTIVELLGGVVVGTPAPGAVVSRGEVDDAGDVQDNQWGDDWGDDDDDGAWRSGGEEENGGLDEPERSEEGRDPIGRNAIPYGPSSQSASSSQLPTAAKKTISPLNGNKSPMNVSLSASPIASSAATSFKPLKLSSSPTVAEASPSDGSSAAPASAAAAAASGPPSGALNANKDLGAEFDVKAIRVQKKLEKPAEEIDFFADMTPDFGGGGTGTKKDKKAMKGRETNLFSAPSLTPSLDTKFGVMSMREDEGRGGYAAANAEDEPTGWQDADDDIDDNWDDF